MQGSVVGLQAALREPGSQLARSFLGLASDAGWACRVIAVVMAGIAELILYLGVSLSARTALHLGLQPVAKPTTELNGAWQRRRVMPLSNEEQRLLDELEASLMAEDPRLAQTMGSPTTPRQIHGRRAGLAGLGFLLGLILLLVGMQTVWIVSVLGFVAMLASAIIALSAWRHVDPKEAAKNAKGSRPTTPDSAAFMDKMEDRWRRRQNDGGF